MKTVTEYIARGREILARYDDGSEQVSEVAPDERQAEFGAHALSLQKIWYQVSDERLNHCTRRRR